MPARGTKGEYVSCLMCDCKRCFSHLQIKRYFRSQSLLDENSLLERNSPTTLHWRLYITGKPSAPNVTMLSIQDGVKDSSLLFLLTAGFPLCETDTGLLDMLQLAIHLYVKAAFPLSVIGYTFTAYALLR
jgi:hypothetical protein